MKWDFNRWVGEGLRWGGRHGFLLGLLISVLLAWFAPKWGGRGGALRSEITMQGGVFLIFLLQGLRLPTEQLFRSLREGKLHLFVLGWNYVGFPLVALGFVYATGAMVPGPLRLGILYLAILPTTITSAVVFTTAAGGSVGGAIFSTAASNLLSVVITPLWAVVLLFHSGAIEINLTATLWKLVRLIVLPLCLGQAMRPLVRDLLPRLKPFMAKANAAVIFFIIYCTFSNSVEDGIWSGRTGLTVLYSGLTACVFLAAVSCAAWYSSGWLRLPRALRIAAFYCASQKSLATGVPMAASIVPLAAIKSGAVDLGIMLLPLMCYHPLQLTLAAVLVDRFKAWKDPDHLDRPDLPGR